MAVASIGGGVASAQTVTTADTTTETTAVEQTSTTGTTTTTTQTTPSTPTGDSAGTTGDETTAGDSAGTTQGSRAGDSLKLKLEDTSPGRIFFRGKRKAVFNYKIGGTRPADVKILVAKRHTGKVMHVWKRRDVTPDERHRVRWSGKRDGGGEAPKGKYFFKVKGTNGREADRSAAKGDRSVELYPQVFPVRGRHDYGDGYGAGRGHRGQDVFAKCGTKMVAARAGKVQWKAYQGSGAGYYVVIDGNKDRHDYVYMHLKGPAKVHEGERVRTGERIGRVGDSGNASGCHLHFELWKGDWYGGGHAMRKVTKNLKRWDRWS